MQEFVKKIILMPEGFCLVLRSVAEAKARKRP